MFSASRHKQDSAGSRDSIIGVWGLYPSWLYKNRALGQLRGSVSKHVHGF